MKPVKEDTNAILNAARRRYPQADATKYVGYNSQKGHVWIICSKEDGWLAHGWFGADGEPHFYSLKNK